MSERREYATSEFDLTSTWIGDIPPLDLSLWILVLGASAADMVLTLIGLQLCFVEANPVAATAIEHFGSLGLFLLKGSSILVLFAVVRQLSRKYTLAALLGFSLPQVVATGLNSFLLLNRAGACPGV